MTVDEALGVEREEESIGLALSGGGIRAALFSLGVLIGIVDSGQNRRVKHISSVSGGSIVNAALAQSVDLGLLTSADKFRPVAEPIAETLCRRGAFVFTFFFNWPSLAAFARYVALRVVGLVVVGVVVWVVVDELRQEGHLVNLPWGWIALGGVVGLVAILIAYRGVAQQAIYALLLRQVPAPDAGTRKLTARLANLPEHEVTQHVIVATDLVSGKPVYFARDFVLCPAFGWGKPGSIKNASAVYASAAFPLVFPAKRFDRRRFGFQNGDASPPFPRVLKLTDGGVYNNLGTDWFDVLEQQERRELWKFGKLDPQPALVPVDRRIVVNAGAASRVVSRVRPFLWLPRLMNVLYDNTVQPRLRELREIHDSEHKIAPFVIDISESPYDIARRHAAVDVDRMPEKQREHARTYRKRAQVLADWLGRKPDDFWISFARNTSNTPTKLTKAGLDSGARMIFHGYLSAIVVMNILYDAAPPGGIPCGVKDESYFLNLAKRTKGADSDGSPTAEHGDAEHAGAVTS